MPIDPYILEMQRYARDNRQQGVNDQVNLATMPPAAPPGPPTMSQSQFSGYPGAPGPGSRMTPQQAMMLIQLLKARQAAQPPAQPQPIPASMPPVMP
jgi:hypothetical protein